MGDPAGELEIRDGCVFDGSASRTAVLKPINDCLHTDMPAD